MISTNYSTNHSPSFKQVNLIRVSKKAFSKPNDLLACTIDFGNALDKVSGNKKGLMDIIYALAGKKGEVKTVHNLEGTMGLKFIDAPLQEDVHTFSVLTGEEKDAVSEQCSIKNIINMAKSFVKKETNKAPQEIIIENTKNICKDKPVIEFRIDKLEELDSLKTMLGIK